MTFGLEPSAGGQSEDATCTEDGACLRKLALLDITSRQIVNRAVECRCHTVPMILINRLVQKLHFDVFVVKFSTKDLLKLNAGHQAR